MSVDRRPSSPPDWAESLLRVMLSPKDRESVSGDLLEEYRESIEPSLGAGANRWYVRQVAGFVLRETWIWALLVASICVWRYLLDTLVPIHYTPGVITLRSQIMSWAFIATFASCAAWHAWRTTSIGRSILLVAISAFGGSLLAQLVTLLCLAFQHDPLTLAAIRGSGGFDELFIGPSIGLTMLGAVTGLPGAIAGRIAAAIYGASRPNTKSA
jgi:hypothetical protein